MRITFLTENNRSAAEISSLLAGVMLRILIVLFLVFILSAFYLSGNPGEKKNPADGPSIAFTETEHDFGIIQYGADAIHYFVFSNKGDVPLVIMNVRASCGCMASEWPKKPLAAGAKDSLRVEYNTKVKGVFIKTITVQSNAVNASVELRIKGSVIKAK